jgi:hypothetical protein
MDFNGLQCFYTNADSLPNKLGELITRIQDEINSYEVIGITEIYPQNCRYLPGKAELQLVGYELFLSIFSSFVSIRSSVLGSQFSLILVFSMTCWNR